MNEISKEQLDTLIADYTTLGRSFTVSALTELRDRRAAGGEAVATMHKSETETIFSKGYVPNLLGFASSPLYLHPSNSGVAVTEEMVERGHRAQMSELFLRCQPDRGDVFGFMDDRKDVMRIALVAAFNTSPEANKNEGE